MKKPTLNEWIAIVLSVIALIGAIISAFQDGKLTAEESADIRAKSGAVVETVTDAFQE